MQRLNVNDAISQAKADCGDKHPVVAHRRNGGEWLVTMPSGVFFSMIESPTENKPNSNNKNHETQ